jgi:hypothetical protein
MLTSVRVPMAAWGMCHDMSAAQDPYKTSKTTARLTLRRPRHKCDPLSQETSSIRRPAREPEVNAR